MIKKISIFGILLTFCFISASCESDDICNEKVITPRLILRVFDKNNPKKTKNITNLLVIGKNQNTALHFGTTDSIILPLKIFSNQTQFSLIEDASFDNQGNLIKGNLTELKINYTPKQEFLNKACGYRAVFDNISVETTNNSWISSIKIIQNFVKNEDKAIIYIYF